mgnify:CR=1 FL=1
MRPGSRPRPSHIADNLPLGHPLARFYGKLRKVQISRCVNGIVADFDGIASPAAPSGADSGAMFVDIINTDIITLFLNLI